MQVKITDEIVEQFTDEFVGEICSRTKGEIGKGRSDEQAYITWDRPTWPGSPEFFLSVWGDPFKYDWREKTFIVPDDYWFRLEIEVEIPLPQGAYPKLFNRILRRLFRTDKAHPFNHKRDDEVKRHFQYMNRHLNPRPGFDPNYNLDLGMQVNLLLRDGTTRDIPATISHPLKAWWGEPAGVCEYAPFQSKLLISYTPQDTEVLMDIQRPTGVAYRAWDRSLKWYYRLRDQKINPILEWLNGDKDAT